MENMNSSQLKRKFNQIEERIDVALSSSCVCVWTDCINIHASWIKFEAFHDFLMDIFNEDFNNFSYLTLGKQK